jgi:hypothetical protein
VSPLSTAGKKLQASGDVVELLGDRKGLEPTPGSKRRGAIGDFPSPAGKYCGAACKVRPILSQFDPRAAAEWRKIAATTMVPRRTAWNLKIRMPL